MQIGRQCYGCGLSVGKGESIDYCIAWEIQQKCRNLKNNKQNKNKKRDKLTKFFLLSIGSQKDKNSGGLKGDFKVLKGLKSKLKIQKATLSVVHKKFLMTTKKSFLIP